jgi:hypothetical protein
MDELNIIHAIILKQIYSFEKLINTRTNHSHNENKIYLDYHLNQ